MIEESKEEAPMTQLSLYRAVYRDTDLKERNLDMLSKSLSRATLTAAELIPTGATLLRVFHNPDW